MPNRRLNVFLCHAKEDKPTVRELYRQLTAEGWMDVWLDEENLFPGQEWDMEIEKAVEQADVVVVCLSTHSVNKEGYVQKELRFVLNIADEKPEGTIFVVPLRLDDCVVPRRIRNWQYVDYFPKGNQKWAYQRLLESLKKRAEKLGISANTLVPPITPLDDGFARAKREQTYVDRRRLAAYQSVVGRDNKGMVDFDSKFEEWNPKKVPVKRGFNPVAILAKLPKSVKRFIVVFGILVLTSVCLTFGSDYVFNKIFTFVTMTPTVTNLPTQASKVASTFTSIPATFSPTVAPTYILTHQTESTLGVGSTWTSPKDGMVMMFVPAGKFSMGSGSDEHEVALEDFWIDRTEVTNSMFANFLNLEGNQTEGGVNWLDSSHSLVRIHLVGNVWQADSGYEDHPVIEVSWYGAKAYCDWRSDGTRLPTEAEWEKAASWDDKKKEKRVYPWGDSIDCLHAKYSSCNGGTTEVGSYPSGASFYGLLDMAGNVLEWVNSLYQSYPYRANDGREELSASGDRVLRGGSWSSYSGDVRSSVRFSTAPDNHYYIIGFRCARSP